MINIKDLNLTLPINEDINGGRFLNIFFKKNIFDIKKVKKEKKILQNIQFHLKKGESLGIIGPNGSGKTSLLRILAGIYKDYTGSVNISQDVTSLLDLNSIALPDSNGFENIFVILRILNKKPNKSLIEEIAHFSGIGEDLFLPMKNYSSGMKARLVFAASTQFYSDIFLIDENIFVGDNEFISKSIDRINNLKKSGSSIILASHSETLMKKYCDKGLYLSQGVQKSYGNLDKIITDYHFDLNSSRMSL